MTRKRCRRRVGESRRGVGRASRRRRDARARTRGARARRRATERFYVWVYDSDERYVVESIGKGVGKKRVRETVPSSRANGTSRRAARGMATAEDDGYDSDGCRFSCEPTEERRALERARRAWSSADDGTARFLDEDARRGVRRRSASDRGLDARRHARRRHKRGHSDDASGRSRALAR